MMSALHPKADITGLSQQPHKFDFDLDAVLVVGGILKRQHSAKQGHERRRVLLCLRGQVADRSQLVASCFGSLKDGVLKQCSGFIRHTAVAAAGLWVAFSSR